MNTKFKVITWLAIAIIWMGVIFNFSSMDTNESNGKSVKIIDTVLEKTFDITNKVKITNTDSHSLAIQLSQRLNRPLRKVAHASIYFVLGILLTIFLKFCHVKKYYLYSLIISFLYACTDEFHQKFVSGRTSSISDVLIDTTGCIVGLLLFYFIEKMLRKKEVKEEVVV